MRSAQQEAGRPINRPTVPFSAPPEQKLGVTHTTQEGLQLSRGPNGELHATIQNENNDIGIGYVRKSGAFSTETYWTKVCDNVPGGKTSLNSVTMSGTYSLKVVHNGVGRTTLEVDIDRSVEAMKIQVGNKVYLLRESDIKELDRKVTSTTISAAPTQALPRSGNALAAPPSGQTPPVVTANLSPGRPAVIPIPAGIAPNLPATRPEVLRPADIAREPSRVTEDIRTAEPKVREVAKPESSAGVHESSEVKTARGSEVAPQQATSEAPHSQANRQAAASKSSEPRVSVADTVVASETPNATLTESSPKFSTENSPVASNTSPSPTTSSAAEALSSATPDATVIPEPTINARLIDGLKRFNQNIKVSEWARNNQFKAMTYAAAMSEAVTEAMVASYKPNDLHSPIPTILKLLDTDIEKGFQFTTQQGGLAASIAAEATKGAGDAALAFGSFASLDAGVTAAATTRVGQALGGRVAASAFSRTLGVVGIAYHGYSTFSDGSFAHQNDLQLAGSTASPVVMGAIIGAPLGPVGAGGGALLGAGSEAVGVAVGYSRLKGQIQSDWKKREVREALRLAEEGFIVPSDDPLVTSRKPFEQLPKEHQEVLTDVARLATLARLTRELHGNDLSALGFQPEPDRNASAEERQSIGTHNWERIIQLTEGRAGYNPYRLWAGDYIDELRRERPWLADKFETFYREAKDHYKNLYNHAPHVSYNVTDSRVTEESELLKYIRNVVASIPEDSKETDTLKRLEETFPGIEIIMQNPRAREKLTNFLENESGNTGRFRRLFDL